MDAIFLNGALGGALLLTIVLWYLRRHSLPTPPGPSGLPVIGYLRTIATPAWKTYLQWSQDYGNMYLGSDVIGYKAFGKQIVVLNSFKAASDLLDKRSAIYSDRPLVGMTMATELVGFRWSSAAAPYHGRYWRESRKLFQHALNPQAARQYRPLQTVAVHKFLRNLLEAPLGFRDHTRYMVGAIIIRLTYGIEAQEKNDPYIATAERAAWIVNESLAPGKWLVDLIPTLRYLPEWAPGAGFKRKARVWKSNAEAMFSDAFVAMKKNDGLPEDCVGKHMMETIDSEDTKDADFMENVAIKGSLATMYLAGTDTTTTLLNTFFLAMTCNLDAQREAQKEVDRVCEGRLPEFMDYDLMPYVHAIVKECLRWRTAVPLALPHMTTQDDIYDGYFIPAGSVVIPNMKAMLLDPDTYPDPNTFKPARFLKIDPSSGQGTTLDTEIPDPAPFAFGFGRRSCTGRWLAYDTLWITIASILATFDITPVQDKDGNFIFPRGEYRDGLSSHAEPFECNIKPRSLQHRALINDATEVAM